MKHLHMASLLYTTNTKLKKNFFTQRIVCLAGRNLFILINAYMWNLEKWYNWTCLQSRNGDTDVENKRTDAKGEEGVGWSGRLGLTYIHYYVWNGWPMRTYCVAQGTLLSALWWPGWEGEPRKRGYIVYVWPIHFAVQQKLTRHCKATILQLKKKFIFKYCWIYSGIPSHSVHIASHPRHCFKVECVDTNYQHYLFQRIDFLLSVTSKKSLITSL